MSVHSRAILKRPLHAQVHQASAANHDEPMRLEDKQKNCSVCVAKGSKVKPENERRKRKPLGELSQNTIQLAADRDRIRPKQYPKISVCVSYVLFTYVAKEIAGATISERYDRIAMHEE